MKTVQRYANKSKYNRARIIEEIKKYIVADGGTVLHANCAQKITLSPSAASGDEEFAKQPPVEYFGFDGCGGLPNLEYIKDGYFYYIEYDENPFFPIHFRKVKVDESGNYTGIRYTSTSDEVNIRSWKNSRTLMFTLGYDGIFKTCDDSEIEEMAQFHYRQIKEVVEGGAESGTIFDKKRIPNYYNSGYHYERVFDKSQINIFKGYSIC